MKRSSYAATGATRFFCLPSLLLIGCLLVPGVSAHAQTAPTATAAVPAKPSPIAVVLKAWKIESVDGKERLSDAKAARPGDTIEYHATYSNRSQHAITGVAATLPIPDGTVYVADSAQPAQVSVRTAQSDRYKPLPLTRQIADADGIARTEAVPATEFRSLRWQLGELAAGAEQTVTARVRIPTPTPLTAAQPAAAASTPLTR